ncbi:MAG: acyl-CoA dehydrogenase family protein, partial [Pseudomonadota bacterium]
MRFELTEEQAMIQAAARDFAQSEIAPVAADFDASGAFPEHTIAKAGELGFMGIEVPEAFGGAQLDAVSYALMLEEIAAADGAHSTIVSVNNSLYNNGIMLFGNDAQRSAFVEPVASGQAIGAYALTEPQSGSDSSNMRSTAVLSSDGGHYVINAKKSWITSGPVAQFIVVFAMTDADAGSRGVSAFLIDTSKPGFQRGKTEPKLGIRASATCEIELTDYECPVEHRLGNEGEGFKIAMTVLDAGRIGIAAQAIGIARAAYEAAVDYSRERQAFGAPIGTFQMNQAKIADMKTRLEAARLLTLQAAWSKDEAKKTGARNTLNSSMAK